MLKRIMDAITGKREVVTLGLDKATAIFQEAKGKFDGSANKAVPFAIMATARALGAEVTLLVEGKQKIVELSSRGIAVHNAMEVVEKDKNDYIASLEKKIKEARKVVQEEKERAAKRVIALEKEATAVKEVVDFFTV